MKDQETVFPKRRLAIFITAFALLMILFILFSTPVFNMTLAVLDPSATDDGIFTMEGPTAPGIMDYFVIGIRANNTGSVPYPALHADIGWGQDDVGDYKALQGQKFKIFVDGTKHDYYIPVGENKFWAAGLNGKSGPMEAQDIIIELPRIDGTGFSVDKIELKRRAFFPIDIYFNLMAKSFLGIQPSFLINRFLTPAYILLICLLASAGVFQLLFKNYLRQGSFTKGPTRSKKGFTRRMLAAAAGTILVIFSFYFLALQAYTIKSYWDSYKKYIISGDLDKTYLGFNDFEIFISWLDQKIPDGENIIVLVRGKPVYIMSEMAYNLYPRNIKFVNISKKEGRTILEDIIRASELNGGDYKYVIALSGSDTTGVPGLSLINSYTDGGGLVYTFK